MNTLPKTSATPGTSSFVSRLREFGGKTMFQINACTLVPTVFLRHGKTEFELPGLFSVYTRYRKREFKIRFYKIFKTVRALSLVDRCV